ncbi:MAG: AAA family ATPase [Patescibacteria group bacterium]
MKQVAVVGGNHGAGKTTLCSVIQSMTGCLTAKQRQLVVEIGGTEGLSGWDQIGPYHDDFIERAAWLVLMRFLASKSELLLIDGHFSIRRTKALRKSAGLVNGKFVPDLDPRLLGILNRYTDLKLIYLETSPEVAIERFSNRETALLDFDNTQLGMAEKNVADKECFDRLIETFSVKPIHWIVLCNEKPIDETVQKAMSFISPLSPW